MKYHIFLLVLILAHKQGLMMASLGVDATSDNPDLTFESLYTDGINSYLENDWGRCISYLELALNDWHWWNKNISRCRKKCYEAVNSAELIFPSSPHYEYDRIFEKMVINTLCLVKCKKNVFGSRMDRVVPVDVVSDFKFRKPYDYLQLCYFKQGQLDKAANAAVTFLAVQSDHEVMQGNLRYYVKEGGLDISNIINLEMDEYAKEYVEGDLLYQDGNYAEAINHMEKSLTLFWQALEECQLGCENPFDQGWFPDFVSSIANHFTFTLRCKIKCNSQLSNLFGEEIQNFVASIFNYLQFSYHKVGNLQKGCEAVESYLVLVPGDPSQMRNRQFFWAEKGFKEEFFTPRKEVVLYKQRLDAEARLMSFIDENFSIFLNDDLKLDKAMGKEVSEEAKVAKLLERDNRLKAITFLKALSESKVQLIADDKKLRGAKRFLAKGFLSERLCQDLTAFTKMASVEGDGYVKRNNPHTSSESFNGVTLSRAAMSVIGGFASPSILEVILSVSELSKNYVERHFALSKPLFFSFTHLVCRTGIRDRSERNISDLSHVLHADNCILQPNGRCLKIPPAYTFRDYSAILYLNNDFEGGEFIFSKDRTGVQFESLIKPQCGHLVGFSAGQENLHGVRPVYTGTRCALAMWFTFDPKYQEVERTLAEKLLQKINNGEIIPFNQS